MEPIESSETSAYINTLTPGTYPKEKKLQDSICQVLNTAFLYAAFDFVAVTVTENWHA